LTAPLDATAQAQLIRDGETTAAELVEAAIARVEALNPEINAVIHTFFDEALEQARAGAGEGPFAGVPFVLKDLGATLAGQPFHLGMKVLKEAAFHAPLDSYLGQRFKRAGLITIGKTNLPELGILPTTEPDAYGPTRNPWDTSRSVGGSSGGSAAAVASGMVAIAHANDGGGSIRIPASAAGLVGLKPTRQRVSEGPLIGDVMSGLTTELVVSRSVRDTAAVLDAVHGPAPGDPYAAPAPARPYVQELDADPQGLRIGLLEHPPIEGLRSDSDCIAAVRDAAELLESLGHSVEPASPLDEATAQALDLEQTFLTRWAAGQAGALAQFSMLLGREIGPDDVEPLTWTMAELGRERSAGDYLGAVSIHQGISRAIAGWHESGFDLQLTPTMAAAPVPLGTHDDSGSDPLDAYRAALPQGAFTAIYNATGQPAISLPLHWTEGGLPVGVQLAAPFGREDLLIGIAAQVERARPWAERTPAVFAR
jgi:amidase